MTRVGGGVGEGCESASDIHRLRFSFRTYYYYYNIIPICCCDLFVFNLRDQSHTHILLYYA